MASAWFGLPLMPVDRHVERVAHGVGLIGPKVRANDAHDLFMGMLEPDQMYEAHVKLIQHGRKLCQCPTTRVRRLARSVHDAATWIRQAP